MRTDLPARRRTTRIEGIARLIAPLSTWVGPS
jgi:hypothetical protein